MLVLDALFDHIQQISSHVEIIGSFGPALPVSASDHVGLTPRYPNQQMRWMAPAHGIWVPKCEGLQAFTSKMGAIRYADYHDRPRLGQEHFSGPRC
jgi:hypothetical protein